MREGGNEGRREGGKEQKSFRAFTHSLLRSFTALQLLLLRPILQPSAQARDRLAVELTHARLRDAEDLADFFQVHLLLVVQAHHYFLALRQRADRLHEVTAEAIVLEH